MSFSIQKKNILNKKIFNSFKNIYGLGSYQIKQLTKYLGLNSNLKIKYLTNTHIEKIKFFFENQESLYFLKDSYRKTQLSLIKLFSIACYRGNRLRRLLPARGQRTHSNAKSCRRNKLIIQILSTLK